MATKRFQRLLLALICLCYFSCDSIQNLENLEILAIAGSGYNTFALVNGVRYALHLKHDNKDVNFTFLKLPDPIVISLPKANIPFSRDLYQTTKCEQNDKFKLGKDLDGDYFLLYDSEAYSVDRELLRHFCKNEDESIPVSNSQEPLDVIARSSLVLTVVNTVLIISINFSSI